MTENTIWWEPHPIECLPGLDSWEYQYVLSKGLPHDFYARHRNSWTTKSVCSSRLADTVAGLQHNKKYVGWTEEKPEQISSDTKGKPLGNYWEELILDTQWLRHLAV